MEAILNGDMFSSVLKGLKTLVSEAKWHFKEEGLHSRAVDPANVAMVIVDVSRENMEAYSIDEEKVVGVDVNRIYDIAKSIKKNELVELQVEDETRLKVKFGSVEYRVTLIDPAAIRKEPKIPQLDLPAKIVLDAGEFKKAITAADKISDHVVFRSDETGFYIEAEGDVDKITFHMSDVNLIEFNKVEARSMFGIAYLLEFCKVAGSGDLLTIYLGTDYPVRLVFDVADGKVRVEYILAPRLEREM